MAAETPSTGGTAGLVDLPCDLSSDGSGHECNFYCQDGLHAHKCWTNDELPPEMEAIIAGGLRFNVVRWQEAPELPPVDPLDPEGEAFTHRWIVWTREA